ncbi:hypothetical protein [Deinococcus navajonensis]|uniref:Tetratricopeptide repeat protein n=1 Tax=Deinococcus navajonensis TaxID=309884 RepID=A0ABV8XK71_9DEIO
MVPSASAQVVTARDPQLTQAFVAAVQDAERAWLATNPDRSFLSVGNDLNYALGWLKSGKYSEAMTPLGLTGAKGADDPFVQLFLAFALAGQGKAAEAQAALSNATRLLPALQSYAQVITSYARPASTPAASTTAGAKPTPPQTASPAATKPGLSLTARPVTTMTAALNETERLWASTGPSRAMFSTHWHVEQILYDLRQQNPAGAKVQISAARKALTTPQNQTDRAFLDLLDAFAAAQQGNRTQVTQALSALTGSPHRQALQPLTDFLSTYQPPKATATPAPVASAKPGGPLVAGNYSCWLERPGLNGSRNDVPRGTLTLRTNGTYTYMGKAGAYRYNAQTGVLTFTAGFFANPVPERTTFLKHTKTAQIDIHWAYANDWSCGINLN